MAEFRLHGAAEFGNAYKVAMMLQACGADWECVPLNPQVPESVERLHRLNEMAEAPILEHRALVLSQSGVILDYLAERSGRYGWSNADERREIYRWIIFDNHRFTGPVAEARCRRVYLKIDDAVTEWHQQRFERTLKILERRLSAHDWIVLGRQTIADFSFAGHMFFDGELGFDFKDYPALDAWRARLRAQPNWKAPYELMPRIMPSP
jgi:glutathione S-transferase